MNKIHLSYLLVISVLVILLCLSFNRSEKIEVREERVTDTVTISMIDTIIEYTPKYITKKTVDTIYLPTDNKSVIPIHIEQKHYSKSGEYDAWISGYKPQLDSIKTYKQVEYRTITNNVTKEVEYQKWNLYTYLGFKRFSNKWLPSVGLMAKSRKNTTIYGLELGLDANNKMFYGVSVGYRIK